MTVKELIKELETYEQDLPVAFEKYSEMCLLESGDLYIARGCFPRPDCWIHRVRPDKPSQPYLVFPGN